MLGTMRPYDQLQLPKFVPSLKEYCIAQIDSGPFSYSGSGRKLLWKSEARSTPDAAMMAGSVYFTTSRRSSRSMEVTACVARSSWR